MKNLVMLGYHILMYSGIVKDAHAGCSQLRSISGGEGSFASGIAYCQFGL